VSDRTEDGDDAVDSPADAGKTGGDAGGDLSDVVIRAARTAASALDRVGEAVGELLSGLAGGAGGGGGGGGAEPLVSHIVPEVAPLLPLRAGDEAATRLRLVNDGDSASEPFGVAATDLVSDAGDRILGDAVSLSPDKRVVAAHQADTLPLTVQVPGDAKPGVYRGELRPTDDGVAAVPLVVEVR
jgi:hypothetical protein